MRRPSVKNSAIVLCLIGISLIAFFFGVYRAAGSSKVLHELAVILNLPLGTIDNVPIGFREFDALASALKDVDEGITIFEIRDRVWEKLQEDVAIAQMAEDYNITWSDADVIQYRTSLLGLEADQKQQIREAIAPLKLSFFDEKIVLPLLLRDRVNRELILSEENEDVTYINDVRAQALIDPNAFVALRDAYLAERNLTSAEKTVIVPASELEVSNMAFIRDLKVGDITPIIAAPDGYRVYQIANYFEEPQEAWQLEEFFVPSSIFSKTLTRYKESLTVTMYARGYLQV